MSSNLTHYPLSAFHIDRQRKLPAAAGSFPLGTDPPSLHQRYIFSKVETVNFVASAENELAVEQADSRGEPKRSTTEKPRREGPPSVRTKLASVRTDLFDWLGVT